MCSHGNEDAKRVLAVIVLRLFDQGERDPERLAEIALREWSGTDGSTVGNLGQFGCMCP